MEKYSQLLWIGHHRKIRIQSQRNHRSNPKRSLHLSNHRIKSLFLKSLLPRNHRLRNNRLKNNRLRTIRLMTPRPTPLQTPLQTPTLQGTLQTTMSPHAEESRETKSWNYTVKC
ncbi:hypothetical protein DBV05_g4910 [Lasiodiplodia theobromae]|uniref:Uncharacterized protein n=1 Tax=Lasiodiplodia theobromae TaxID=45133 RepID=A0A5N5DFA2_9PEZI|nr:hypothetical protein DBV05_g4910 [Lasiodiplodia theobromae]